MLPTLAVVGLIGTMTFPLPGRTMVIRMCLGGTHSMPLSGDGDGIPIKSPGACHAVCCRARDGLDVDESDQDN